jgi:hypothetical protein
MPLFFIIYINDLPPTLWTSFIPMITAVDTCVVFSGKNLDDFGLLSNKVLSQMSNCFSVNKLSLNLEKQIQYNL